MKAKSDTPIFQEESRLTKFGQKWLTNKSFQTRHWLLYDGEMQVLMVLYPPAVSQENGKKGKSSWSILQNQVQDE